MAELAALDYALDGADVGIEAVGVMPTISWRSERSATSITASQASSVSASGFSTMTCLLYFSAVMACSAWNSCGDAM